MNVTIDGRSVHADVGGDGDPLLLVHGFPLTGAMWAPVVAALESRCRVVVPDLAGHGRSEPAAGVTMARFADDLAALLDATGARAPAVVVGMSMGGYVAFELLRRHPGRVRALVLTNTRAQPDTPEAAADRGALASRVEREGSAVVADAMLPRLFGPGADDETRARWRALMAATPPAGAAAALRAMAERPDSFPTLAAATCPVLIVAGADDVITPVEDSIRMHEASPGSTLEVVAGAGHMTPVERPDEFLAALRRFLAGLAPLGGG